MAKDPRERHAASPRERARERARTRTRNSLILSEPFTFTRTFTGLKEKLSSPADSSPQESSTFTYPAPSRGLRGFSGDGEDGGQEIGPRWPESRSLRREVQLFADRDFIADYNVNSGRLEQRPMPLVARADDDFCVRRELAHVVHDGQRS